MTVCDSVKHLSSWTCLLGTFLAIFGCSAPEPITLVCDEEKEADASTWVLQIEETERAAEFVVHVPTESIRLGVPPGNRVGSLHVSDRAYEVIIPSDSGGQGEEAWARLQFSFEIDRYTGSGTLEIGERDRGEVVEIPISCHSGSASPRL